MLREQPGTPVVFVPLKSNFRGSRLGALLPGVQVLTERQAHNAYWAGGPMLIGWPDEDMVGRVSHQYASRLTTACVLEWGTDRSVRAWLTANGAIDLITGEPFTAGVATLPPVVEVAMRHLDETVNHSNGLAGYADERDAKRTLLALVRHGHRFDVNDLCAWSVANGFRPSEVQRLRDWGSKALAGTRLRVDGPPLARDTVARWEAEAHAEKAV